MPDNKSSLKQDLIKILVDKLLIGIVLAILGIVATLYIDKLKNERSFFSELDKIRAEKIGEVWEKVYLYEAAAKEADDAIRRETMRNGQEGLEQAKQALKARKNRLSPLKDILKELEREIPKPPMPKEGQELVNTLNKNRFWLGEDMYVEIEDYLAASEEYLSALADKDENKIKDAAKKREESRATITKTRNRLLNE